MNKNWLDATGTYTHSLTLPLSNGLGIVFIKSDGRRRKKPCTYISRRGTHLASAAKLCRASRRAVAKTSRISAAVVLVVNDTYNAQQQLLLSVQQ